MKRLTVIFTFAALVSVLMAPSCRKHTDLKPVVPQVTIHATVPDEATKVALTPDGDGLHLAWEAGDALRVISGSQSEQFAIKDGFTDHEASFTGSAVSGTIFSTALPPDAPQEQKNRKTAAIASTLTVATLGSAAFLASIPCLAVGQVRRKAAIKNYEEWNCASYLSCEQINSYYHNADVMWKTGWGLFGAGMGMFTFGMLCIVPNVFPPAPGPDPYALEKSGFAILGVGCGAVIASVPCICVGHVRRKASQGLYNDKCADQAPLTFSIQSSSNGIGLAMQF